MYRIDVIDGVATMVARDAPVAPEPALFARSEDTIVLRPSQPLKVIPPEAEPEVELEVREIDDWNEDDCHRLIKGRKASRKVVVPARMSAGGRDLYSSWTFDDDGTEYEEPKWEEPPDYVPTGETDSEEEEEEDEEEEDETPYQAEPASTSIPVGGGIGASITTKYTSIFSHFYNDRLKEEKGGKKSKTDIYHIFVKWQKENDIEDVPLGQLWWYMDDRFQLVRGHYVDLGIKWKAGEYRQFQAEKIKQVKSGINVDKLIEETSWIDEYTKNPYRQIQLKKVYGEEPLLEIVERDNMKIYRHPEYTMYGGDLKTGKIYKLKRNTVMTELDTQVDKGITLSLGSADGRRLQKNMKTSQFIADCGKLEKPSEFHKVKIDKLHHSFITRPSPMFYPFDCLSYEYKNEIVKELVVATDKNKDISGARLVGTLKSSTEIENYITRLKEQYIAELKKKDDEIKNKDAQIKKLEAENVRLKQDCIKPLKAGAIQLQELLMTEHQGTTVWEMLQFCVKDITRDYPKDDERSDPDDDLIFGLPECGLPDRNEIITR